MARSCPAARSLMIWSQPCCISEPTHMMLRLMNMWPLNNDLYTWPVRPRSRCKVRKCSVSSQCSIKTISRRTMCKVSSSRINPKAISWQTVNHTSPSVAAPHLVIWTDVIQNHKAWYPCIPRSQTMTMVARFLWAEHLAATIANTMTLINSENWWSWHRYVVSKTSLMFNLGTLRVMWRMDLSGRSDTSCPWSGGDLGVSSVTSTRTKQWKRLRTEWMIWTSCLHETSTHLIDLSQWHLYWPGMANSNLT